MRLYGRSRSGRHVVGIRIFPKPSIGHSSARPAYLYLGGYGISLPHGENLQVEQGQNRLAIHGGENHSVIKVLQAPEGKLDYRLLEPRPGWQHSHNFGGKGAFPYWQSSQPVASNTPVVIYVDGTRGRPLFDPRIPVSMERGLLQVNFEGKNYQIQLPY